MSAEIKTVSHQPIVLKPGDGGIFEIRRDGEILFKKTRAGGFPLPGEAAALFAQ